MVHLDPQTAKSIDDLITSFLQKYKPIDVSRWEEKHNYVWVTMIPFVSLAFSGRNIDVELQSSGLHNCTGVCQKHDAILLPEQEQTDGTNFLPANQNGKEKGQESYAHSEKQVGVEDKTEESANSTSFVASNTSNCGSQSSVADTAACPATMLGSPQTQQLGLFTLTHMLYSSENRQLVEGEHLLSYLDCLCWHVNSEEGKLLRAELTKYWSPRPASLKIICNSILAFVCGFEAVFKM